MFLLPFLTLCCVSLNAQYYSASTNGHFLLTPERRPLLVCACTAWTLTSDYTMEEVCAYLDNRRNAGFNAIQMSAVFSEIDKQAYQRAFADDDITKPVDAYWRHVDSIICEVTARGLIAIINPIWKRSVNDFIHRQGIDKCRIYGEWFAHRYKNNPRVFYFIGGDQVPEPVREEMDAMGCGIQSVYGGKALVAYHSCGSQSSCEAFPDADWLTWNWTYAYSPSYHFEGEPRYPYQMNYENLKRHAGMPIHFGEGYYDFGKAKNYSAGGTSGRWGNSYVLRRQAWWNVLSGASGVAYGAEGIWHKNRDGERWQDCLEYGSGRDIGILRKVMERLCWWKMYPDMDHQVLVDGYGDYLADNYALASVATDSSFALIYTPVAQTLHIRIPHGCYEWLSNLRWIDPTNGEQYAVSSFTLDNDLLTIPPTCHNHEGGEDWLLLLGGKDHSSSDTAENLMPYQVPEEKRVRVIVSTDAANEVDDAFMIMHALLTPQFDIRGIVAAHFRDRRPQSMELSYEEVERLLDKSHIAAPLYRGAVRPMADALTPQPSEGADLIVREALSDDPRRLFVICGGPLTEVATALLLHPEIASHLTIVWSGGGPFPENAREFNLENDTASVNAVYDSKANLWQVPSNVYSMVRIGMAEMALKVRPCGEIGRYLYDTLDSFNHRMSHVKGWPRGEDWTWGDSPAVSIIMNPNQHTDSYVEIPAPRITPDLKYEQRTEGRKIRMYTSIDGRVVLEDFLAKLQLAYSK